MTDDVFGGRIDARPAFERSRQELLRHLAVLGPEDWERETAARPWTVRDVVSHVVGDDLNRLSRSRDHHRGDGPAAGEDLAAFVHRINDEWVRGTARLSPTVLQGLLARSTSEVLAFWRSADLDVLGEPVSWVSPRPAPVWLDCARDFTEYWLHHRQIEEAVGGAVEEHGTSEVLDVLLRAVPHTLSGVQAEDGVRFGVHVHGASGGSWVWRHRAGTWIPAQPGEPPHTWIRFAEPADLWKLCVRMISPAEAAARVTVGGDGDLTRQALQIVSIIRYSAWRKGTARTSCTVMA